MMLCRLHFHSVFLINKGKKEEKAVLEKNQTTDTILPCKFLRTGRDGKNDNVSVSHSITLSYAVFSISCTL